MAAVKPAPNPAIGFLKCLKQNTITEKPATGAVNKTAPKATIPLSIVFMAPPVQLQPVQLLVLPVGEK